MKKELNILSMGLIKKSPILIEIALISLLGFYFVFAAPPTSQYDPGETLDPSCAPSTTNCSVKAPATAGANTNITSLSGLGQITIGSVGSFGTSTLTGSAFFGNYTAGNYTEIENDGTIEFIGNATVWDDLRFPAQTLSSGATPPDNVTWANANLRTKGFDGSGTLESVEVNIQMPHTWKVGSLIYPHIHWGPTTVATGTVKWIFEYTQANVNGTFSTATTVSSSTEAISVASQWKQFITALPAIDTTGWGLSSMTVARLYRDPTDVADTYAGDAGLLEFDVHYQQDTIGSRDEYTK